ncbi:MAG: GvpL/GvpF family gas vesicle protein [Bacteroidota bacterium]
MGKLIYTIIKASEEPRQLTRVLSGMHGISNAEFLEVSCEGITAVVCDIQKTGMVAGHASAMDYAGVIEKLSKDFTLLPVRFGSIMETDDDIRKMLSGNHLEIKKNLLKVEGKVEFGLKVFCDTEKLKSARNIEPGMKTKSATEAGALHNNSVYLDYVNKKLTEYRLEESVLSYVNSVIEEITDCFAGFEASGKFNKMVSPANIIDALFLIKKEMTAELISVVQDLQTRYSDLNFILTGPWPPYNFVDITIS